MLWSKKLKRERRQKTWPVNILAGKGIPDSETNWRYFHKEIDIIAVKDDRLVIVEVKSTYRSNYYNAPSDLLSNRKMRFLVGCRGSLYF